MLTTKATWNFVRVTAILALAAIPGLASPIFVDNFSFETLPAGALPNGCGLSCSFSFDAIPGWTTSAGSVSGQFQPGTQDGNSSAFSTLSDGITSAFANVAGTSISQVVLASTQVGQIYTLLVDIGYRNDMEFAGTAALLINGNTYTATPVGPLTRGTFGTFKATYTGLQADGGSSLTVSLQSSGLEANFDNVRVLETFSPEPAPFLLIGSALLLLQALGRRRSSKTRS